MNIIQSVSVWLWDLDDIKRKRINCKNHTIWTINHFKKSVMEGRSVPSVVSGVFCWSKEHLLLSSGFYLGRPGCSEVWSSKFSSTSGQPIYSLGMAVYNRTVHWKWPVLVHTFHCFPMRLCQAIGPNLLSIHTVGLKKAPGTVWRNLGVSYSLDSTIRNTLENISTWRWRCVKCE